MFIGYSGGSGWNYGLWSILPGIGNAVFGSLLAWLVLAKRTRESTQRLKIKMCIRDREIGKLFGGNMDTAVLKRLRGCTAVVCYNDQIAVRFAALLKRRGLRVSKDISISSFDNSPLAKKSVYNLTSVVYPCLLYTSTYRRLQEHINACAILRAYCDKMGYQKDFSHNLRFARWMLTINVIGEIIQLNPEKREQSIPRDILNAVRQIRAFKNKQLPIKGEPWEEVIRNTLYRNEEVPNYLNYYRDEEKPYCSFYDDYDSEQKKQYAEI